MAFDHSRRASASPAPPPAPPLPPQRYADVAKTVLDRLRLGARKPASSQPVADDLKDELLFSPKFGPSASQSASHKTGLRLRALDGNGDKTRVVLAGGRILKTLRLDSDGCVEDFDLRSVALNYWDINPENQPPPKHRDHSTVEDVASIQRATFDIEDVAWSNGQYDRIIATAVSNGNIILYDLERPGVVARHLREHHRQVHKIDFNPAEGKCLLSGSQDGTVILWDLRSDRGNAMAALNSGIYDGRSEGVRHVKWSPTDTWSFAFGTDNGAIQRWDTRQLKAPLWKVLGHSGICNSVDWHPDGKHLVSAGKDKTVRIWNMSPEMRKRKSVAQIHAPHEVQNVRWRPSCFVSDANANNVKQCTHFATSYRKYPYVHIWDLRRPHIPFKEVYHQVNSGTNDMMWRSRDLLWTVGPGGEFMQTDVQYAANTLDRRPLQTITNAPDGGLGFFTRSRTPSSNADFGMKRGSDPNPKTDKKLPESYFGRSPGDDSLTENFLSSSYRSSGHSRTHSRTPSMKSQSLGATPPTSEDLLKPVVPLDRTLRTFQFAAELQASKYGFAPGTSSSAIFSFFSQQLRSRALSTPPTLKSVARVQSLFERNAVLCQKASRYRDAQTWRIFGTQLVKDINTRALDNRRHRLKGVQPRSSRKERDSSHSHSSQPSGIGLARLTETQTDKSARTRPQSLEPKAAITPSNVPTPTARPINGPNQEALNTEALSLDDEKGAHLPSILSSAGNKPDEEVDILDGSTDAHQTADAQWDTSTIERDEKRAMVNQWKAQPKVPLNFDQPLERSKNINVPGMLTRKDSSDSIMMFSTSSGSHPKMSAAQSFVSGDSSSAGHGGNHTLRHRLRKDHSFQSGHSSNLTASSDANSDPNIHETKESYGSSESQSFLGSAGYDSPEERQNYVKTNEQRQSVMNEGSPMQKNIDDNMNMRSGSREGPDKRDVESSRLSESQRTNSDPVTGKMDDIDETEPVTKAYDQSHAPAYRKENASILPETSVSNLNEAVAEPDSERDSEELILSDFLTLQPDTSDENRMSITAIDLLQRLLVWYTDRADAQAASHLYLLSAPLLAPTTIADGPGTSSSILTNHCTTSSLHEDIKTLGISPTWVESILSTYHEQLISLNLLSAATDLRRRAYPYFPSVYEQGVKDTEIGLLCLECRKPINHLGDRMRCETCKSRQASCPICWSKESPYGPAPILKEPKKAHLKEEDGGEKEYSHVSIPPSAKNRGQLWSSCGLCNHGAHAACAYAWFAEGDGGGGCPVYGCLCACVDGMYRREKQEKLESLEWVKGKRKAGVAKDEWRVGESNAASRARGVLWGKATSTDTVSASSPVSPGTEKAGEDGRRVRINVPGGRKKRGG